MRSRAIDVLLREGCGSDDELEALYFAAAARLDLDRLDVSSEWTGDSATEAQLLQYLQGVRSHVDATFDSFRSALVHAGWDLQRHHFDSKTFRVSIQTEDEKHRD